MVKFVWLKPDDISSDEQTTFAVLRNRTVNKIPSAKRQCIGALFQYLSGHVCVVKLHRVQIESHLGPIVFLVFFKFNSAFI